MLVSSVSDLSYADRLARLILQILSFKRARGNMVEELKVTCNTFDLKVTTLFSHGKDTVILVSHIKWIYHAFCRNGIHINFSHQWQSHQLFTSMAVTSTFHINGSYINFSHQWQSHQLFTSMAVTSTFQSTYAKF